MSISTDADGHPLLLYNHVSLFSGLPYALSFPILDLSFIIIWHVNIQNWPPFNTTPKALLTPC